MLVLQSYGKVNLWVTDQVLQEFSRNREAKIADALKKFSDDKPNASIPHVARGYPESEKLIEALKQVNATREALLKKVSKDIQEKSLLADKLVADIFAKSARILMSEAHFLAAKRRAELRNPPGKNDSLGDAINWQCLLEKVPDGQDLFLISEDGDFSSPIDPDRISDFLAEEWTTRKKSNAILYTRLSQLLSRKFPDAKLAAELEKNLLITDLANSVSFAQTHQLIAKLAGFKDFTPKQASDIADAYVSNAQVKWIVSDADVKALGEQMLKTHNKTLLPEQRDALAGKAAA